MRYKVGDLVRIVSNVTAHEFKIGEIVIVKTMLNDEISTCESLDGANRWSIANKEVVPICKKVAKIPSSDNIEITSKGAKTTATLFKNGKYVSHATVKCYFKDTYDFNIGAIESIKKLLGDKKEDNTTYKETKRKAVVGDYIKITNAERNISAYQNGDICLVLEAGDAGIYAKTKGTHPCNIGLSTSYIYDTEYVVLVESCTDLSKVSNKTLMEEVMRRINKI